MNVSDKPYVCFGCGVRDHKKAFCENCGDRLVPKAEIDRTPHHHGKALGPLRTRCGQCGIKLKSR